MVKTNIALGFWALPVKVGAAPFFVNSEKFDTNPSYDKMII